jgi:glycosyltransferase involved in cell wall biosynthesis
LKYSVIINCYNTLPLIQECVKAALETTNQETEILLINNHPPYPEAIQYLKSSNHPRVRILDPGRNIGCTFGFQLGAEWAVGEYIVKLDDDTLVPKSNWLEAMSRALTEFPYLAYVALALPIYPLEKCRAVMTPGYTLGFFDDCVLFSCMMIRKSLWKQHFVITDAGLYGGEELYYMQKANQLGLKKAYLLSHIGEHLGRTSKSDPLYGAWKVFYGFVKTTRLDYPEWRKSFSLGPAEYKILKQIGYPDEQIEEIKILLAGFQSGRPQGRLIDERL